MIDIKITRTRDTLKKAYGIETMRLFCYEKESDSIQAAIKWCEWSCSQEKINKAIYPVNVRFDKKYHHCHEWCFTADCHRSQ